jgi:uncharacterized protein (UPF0371 family)
MSQVNEAHRALVEENKAYMTIVIDILIYTATQNIAQRGNRENLESSNRGNFLELLDLFAKHNLVVKKKLLKKFQEMQNTPVLKYKTRFCLFAPK